MPEESKSIQVQVEFFCGIEDGLDLKDRKTSIDLLKPFSIYHLLDTLIKHYPVLQTRLKKQEELAPDVMIVINNTVTTNDLELHQGDLVFLMYVGVGG